MAWNGDWSTNSGYGRSHQSWGQDRYQPYSSSGWQNPAPAPAPPGPHPPLPPPSSLPPSTSSPPGPPQLVGNPTLPLPNSWSTTNDHYDANAVHGLTFRKQIEATQWSRKKGVAGKDPLNIPVQEFLFHGVSDWRLRALSHGKFFSVVPVASVAEAVFMAQVLKLVRERKVDIDTVATHVFQSDNPAAPIPNKNTDAPTLFQPLVNMIVQILQYNTPVAAGIDQSQKFLQMSEELSRRREQLEAAGVPVTPQKASSSKSTLPVTYVIFAESASSSRCVIFLPGSLT